MTESARTCARSRVFSDDVDFGLDGRREEVSDERQLAEDLGLVVSASDCGSLTERERRSTSAAATAKSASSNKRRSRRFSEAKRAHIEHASSPRLARRAMAALVSSPRCFFGEGSRGSGDTGAVSRVKLIPPNHASSSSSSSSIEIGMRRPCSSRSVAGRSSPLEITSVSSSCVKFTRARYLDTWSSGSAPSFTSDESKGSDGEAGSDFCCAGLSRSWSSSSSGMSNSSDAWSLRIVRELGRAC